MKSQPQCRRYAIVEGPIVSSFFFFPLYLNDKYVQQYVSDFIVCDTYVFLNGGRVGYMIRTVGWETTKTHRSLFCKRLRFNVSNYVSLYSSLELCVIIPPVYESLVSGNKGISFEFTQRDLGNHTSRPGGRLNKKDGLTRYGNSHVKDKTS